jgi:hypothetical protein
MSDAPARDPALPAVPPGTIARPPHAGAASNGPPPEVCTPPAVRQQCGSPGAWPVIGNLTTLR